MDNLVTRTDIEAAVLEKLPKDFASKAAASRVVAEVFSQVGSALAEGKTVRIAGLGTFGTADVPEHTANNPSKPGETVTVPAHKRVTFHASSVVKAAVNA